MPITLSAAQEMAAAGGRAAEQMQVRVVLVVVDAGGHPVLLLRQDGTQYGSVEVALAKARCASAFRRSTKIWEDRVGREKAGYATLPGVLAVEGGLPLFAGGECLGAVGVSGALSTQDGSIAQAMLDAWPGP